MPGLVRFASAALLITSVGFASERAGAQTGTAATPEEALAKAIAARDAAALALEEANKAIASLTATIEPRASAHTITAALPKETVLLPPICNVMAGTVGSVLDDPESYVESCLDVPEHETRVTGVAQADKAAIVLSFTDRDLHPHGPGRPVHSTYHRFRAGLTAAKKDDRFPIYDVGGSQWLRGWGLTGGYEFGRLGSRNRQDAEGSFVEYVAQARRDCINEKLPDAVGTMASLAATQTLCDGVKLTEWIQAKKERRQKYYKAFATAVFQPEGLRALYGGLNGSVAFSRFQYVPAENLPTGPVEGQPGKPNEINLDKTTHELRVYAGGYTAKHFALELGLSHRRTFEDREKHTICPVGTTGFLECWTIRTEKPSELKGFVADARIGVSLDLPVLPGFGALFMPTYEFDAERWGASGSVFFAADDDGKLTSGVGLRCKLKGHDRSGRQLDKDCKAELFVSTSFSLRPKK